MRAALIAAHDDGEDTTLLRAVAANEAQEITLRAIKIWNER